MAPYLAGGLSLLHSVANTAFSTGSEDASSTFSTNSVYVNFGGGVLYAISPRLNLRPEFKIYAGKSSYVRMSAGIEYRFGK